MGGFFGVASKEDCVFDLYFGIDYHSHLGTRRGGMAVLGERGFNRAIHNIENSPFRTKFDKDFQEMEGNFGIGCISDYESQPLIIRSIHGTYALTTISKINNMDELTHDLYKHGHTHFQEMSGGDINATELVATLIDQKDNLIEGINYALEKIDGSLSLLLMNSQGIYAARDKRGRTPVVIGRKKDSFCASFENFAYKNLGFSDYKELGPGEIVVLTPKNCVTLSNPNSDMKICTFLWVYYGYPASPSSHMWFPEAWNRRPDHPHRRPPQSPRTARPSPIPRTRRPTSYGTRAARKATPMTPRPAIRSTPVWKPPHTAMRHRRRRCRTPAATDQTDSRRPVCHHARRRAA